MYRSLTSVLALAAAASAATIKIDVGEDSTIKFNPNTITANPGDQLEFHFYSGSAGTTGHSVVSSSLGSPCVPNANSFFSGYMKGNDAGDEVFIVDVTSTDPIWFYCSYDSHCQSGMVGVVNAPAGKSLSDYIDAAGNVAKASAPASPTGGTATTIAAAASTSSEDNPERTSTASNGEDNTSRGGDNKSKGGGNNSKGGGDDNKTTSVASATSTGSSSPITTTAAGGAGSSATSAASSASSSASSEASSAASSASSAASSASSAASSTAAQVTGNSAPTGNQMPVLAGLAAAVGGLVALMA